MWSRDKDSKSSVPLALGRGAPFRWFGRAAAVPSAQVHDTGPCRTLQVAAPGARPSNTEVCWDESSRRLWVGVWCGGPPDLQQPLKYPIPELFWLRSFYLPSHEGGLAQVRVARGTISIQVPARARPDSAQPSNAPAGQAQPARPSGDAQLPAAARPAPAFEPAQAA